MTQAWNPEAYAAHGSFVHNLADGVLEWLAPHPRERILDIGCGDGQLTVRPMAMGVEVTGIDLSADMIAAARVRGVNAIEASAEQLPFADASFDALFSNAALHWIKDHDAMLGEAHRVLKPGGRFVAEFGGHGNIAAIRAALISTLERHGFHGREDGVNYYPTPEAYARRLTQHGFTVRRSELIPRPTPLGEGGMAEWIRLFRRGVFDSLPESLRDTVVRESTKTLANVLLDDEGRWTSDHVRLRFVATK